MLPAVSTTWLPFVIIFLAFRVAEQDARTTVHFLLDTGSPGCLIDLAASKATGLTIDKDSAKPGRGLDGGSSEILRTGGGVVKLASRVFERTHFSTGALYAFSMLSGNGQHVAIMGNAFFKQFERIEIDFERRMIRFVDPA